MIWVSVDPCPVEVNPDGKLTVGEVPNPDPFIVSDWLVLPIIMGFGSMLVICGCTPTPCVG